MSRYISALLGLLFAFPVGVPAQEGRLPFGGTEYFRFFLHQHQIKPLTNFVETRQDPRSTIMVCLGDVAWINRDFNGGGSLRQFIDAGGAVLIATDSRCDSPEADSWERVFGIQVSGRRLMARADDCFDGNEDRPLVRPKPRLPFAPKDSPFEMFEGIKANDPLAIATNRPSEIQVIPAIRPGYIVSTLAGFPATTKGGDDNVLVDRRWNNFAVSIRRDDGPGRLLVIANQGVFVNGMMKFSVDPETGEFSFPNANIRFTEQMIEWLKGPDGDRSQCLFIHDGKPMTQFAKKVQLPPDMNPPIPPISPDKLINLLLRGVNPMVGELQNRVRPNSALDRLVGRDTFRRWLFVGLTVILAWLMWSRLSRATRKDDRTRWVSLLTLGNLLAKGNTSKRKRDDLIDTGNVYEAARWRVRDRFDRLGGQPDPEGRMPPILMADSSRQAAGLEASVRRLWLIGYGGQAVPVPIRMWDELNLDLERAVRLAGKGIWCFAANVPVK